MHTLPSLDARPDPGEPSTMETDHDDEGEPTSSGPWFKGLVWSALVATIIAALFFAACVLVVLAVGRTARWLELPPVLLGMVVVTFAAIAAAALVASMIAAAIDRLAREIRVASANAGEDVDAAAGRIVEAVEELPLVVVDRPASRAEKRREAVPPIGRPRRR